MRAMNKIECTVRFLTPAFLGDANQSGTWRTPPFKAELRQWWRVVMASRGLDYQALRKTEAQLFGHAWLDKPATKSRVRLRLSRWRPGQLPKGTTFGSEKYLGFGPVSFRGELEHP